MIKQVILVLFILMASSTASEAGIRFIANDSASSAGSSSGSGTSSGSGSGSGGIRPTYREPTFEINYAQQCNQAGFTYQTCPDGYRPIGECPYANGFYMGCCPNQYKYTAEQCIASRMKPSQNSCMGYYYCEPFEGGTY